MDSVEKGTTESPVEGRVSQLSAGSEKPPNALVCSTTEAMEVNNGGDQSKETSQKLSMSEVKPPSLSEFTEESEVSLSTDPNDSLGEICEDFSESAKSETIETEKEVLSEDSQRFVSEGESRKEDNTSTRAEKQHKEFNVQSCESKTSYSKGENVLGMAVKQEKEFKNVEKLVKQLINNAECKSSNSKTKLKAQSKTSYAKGENDLGKAEKQEKEFKNVEKLVKQLINDAECKSSNSKDESVLQNARTQDKQVEIQKDEIKTSKSKGEIVSLKAEKQDVREIQLESDESENSISKEESVSLRAEKQGKEIEMHSDETKTSISKEENFSRKTEKKDKEIKVQSGQSKTSNSKEESALQKAEQQDKESKSSDYKEVVSLKAKKQKVVRETSAKKIRRDQYCQVNCLPDSARSDEVKVLKEKLAISKKDTETMQKLLEDVRKDYEELQKNFEKRESEIKSKAFVEELLKENDEMKKEKAELLRKTSKKEGKVSATSDEKAGSNSSEKRRTGLEKRVDTSDFTCPCFAQNIRKIFTGVTDDFKNAISLIKQSSTEQRESIAKEVTMLKDEYMWALEKKDSEIHAFEETIKGLKSRIWEAEREAADYRSVISSACEEKQKLYDDIRGLKDELARAQHENETSRAALEGMKCGLKKFCTAEEYEELQRLDFKFDQGREADGTPARQTDSNDDVTELRSKVAKYYPVLKKAKKDLTKLKEEKQDVENRLMAKISQATDKEKYLNKKLNKALSDLKESEVKIAEITAQLEETKLENTKLNVKIDELEGQAEDVRRKRWYELKTANDKAKITNDKLALCQAKYDELQEDYGRLRDGYNELKKFWEDINARKMKEIVEESSANENSSQHLLKVITNLR